MSTSSSIFLLSTAAALYTRDYGGLVYRSSTQPTSSSSSEEYLPGVIVIASLLPVQLTRETNPPDSPLAFADVKERESAQRCWDGHLNLPGGFRNRKYDGGDRESARSAAKTENVSPTKYVSRNTLGTSRGIQRDNV